MNLLTRNHTALFRVVLLLLFTNLVASCSEEATETAIIDSLLDNARKFRESGQYQAAVIEVRNAMQQSPEDIRSHGIMANIMLDIGQPRQAMDILEPLENKDAAISLILAESYLEVGKYRSAREILSSELFSADSANAEFMLLQGRLALAEGDYENALSSFNEILALDPNNIEARLGLTNTALSDSDFIAAHEQLDQILALDAANGEALLILSRLEKQADDPEQEEAYLQQAILALPSTDIMTPLRYAVLVGLRDNLTKQGKVNEALIYQSLLAESLPDADQNAEEMQAAVDLLKSGDFVNARQALEALQERAPGSEQITSMLAVVDYLEGKDEAASLKFEDIIDPETSSPIALQLFSMTELRLNQPEKVIELLSKDIDSNNDSRLNALYAVALASSGQLDESEKYFLKSIEWDPNNGRLYLPLVRLYNIQGKTQEALQTMLTAFEKAPDDVLIQRSLTAQHLAAANQVAADSLVAKIVVDFPQSQESQLLAANYYLQSGDLDKGEAALKRVLALGDSRIGQHQYARVLLQKEEYNAALIEFRALISQDEEDGDAYKGLITAFELLKEVDKGLAEVASHFQSSGSMTAALVLSEYYGRNGDLGQSEEWLDKYKGPVSPQSTQLSEALIISKARAKLADDDVEAGFNILAEGLSQHPESTRILVSLITLKTTDNKFVEAETYLEQLSKISDESIVSVLRGDLEASKGNFLAAREAFTEAWQQTPDDRTAFKIFGAMQSGARTPEEIVAFLDEWVEKFPESAVAATTRAGFLFTVGNLEQAQAGYEAAIEQNPQNAIALNNLAWIYGEDQLDKALASSKAAYDLASNRPEIIDSYGWFLLKSGDKVEAVELLRRAAELAPDNEEIQGHLEEAISSQK